MKRAMKRLAWVAPLAAVVALSIPLVRLPVAAAQDAATSQPAAKATVTVMVMDQDQKPASGVRVSLMAAPAGANGGNGQARAGGQRGAAVASGKTDDDGKAVLSNVPDGEYSVVAGSRKTGRGRSKVTVSNGQDATVNITLKAARNQAPATQPQQ